MNKFSVFSVQFSVLSVPFQRSVFAFNTENGKPNTENLFILKFQPAALEDRAGIE
jgi:hypothetical protein